MRRLEQAAEMIESYEESMEEKNKELQSMKVRISVGQLLLQNSPLNWPVLLKEQHKIDSNAVTMVTCKSSKYNFMSRTILCL